MKLRRVSLRSSSNILAKGSTAQTGYFLGAGGDGKVGWALGSSDRAANSTLTYGEAKFLATNGLLTVGCFYNINSILSYTGRDPDGQIINIYTRAISSTQFSESCFITFWNCDWQGVGDYTGAQGNFYSTQYPQWRYAKEALYAENDVVIHRISESEPYRMYILLDSGSPADPIGPQGGSRWSLLSYSDTNGYIREINECIWNWSDNRLESRKCSRGNEYTLTKDDWKYRDTTTYFGYFIDGIFDPNVSNPILLFPWGSDKHKNNKIINSIFSSNCDEAEGNILINSSRIYNNYYNINNANDTDHYIKINNNFLSDRSDITENFKRGFDYVITPEVIFNGDLSRNKLTNGSFIKRLGCNIYGTTTNFEITKNILVESQLGGGGNNYEQIFSGSFYFKNNVCNKFNFQDNIPFQNSNGEIMDFEISDNVFSYTTVVNNSFGLVSIQQNEINYSRFEGNTLGYNGVSFLISIKNNSLSNFYFYLFDYNNKDSAFTFSDNICKGRLDENDPTTTSTKFGNMTIGGGVESFFSGNVLDSQSYFLANTITNDSLRVRNCHFYPYSGLFGCTLYGGETVISNCIFNTTLDLINFDDDRVGLYNLNYTKNFWDNSTKSSQFLWIANDTSPLYIQIYNVDAII
jgi:hypothetical protein